MWSDPLSVLASSTRGSSIEISVCSGMVVIVVGGGSSVPGIGDGAGTGLVGSTPVELSGTVLGSPGMDIGMESLVWS